MPTLTPKTISQAKLKRYKELEAAAKEFEALKRVIKAMAMDGLSCQPGRFSCAVNVIATTSIPWKSEYIKVTSAEAADEVAEKYKGNSERTTLVVTDRDNPTG